MSNHNICFCQEIRKILCGYPLLSVAMRNNLESKQSKACLYKLYSKKIDKRQNHTEKLIYKPQNLPYNVPTLLSLFQVICYEVGTSMHIILKSLYKEQLLFIKTF